MTATAGGTPALFAAALPGDTTVLRASSCPACGRTSFPERGQCPACGGPARAMDLAGPARLRIATAVLAQPPGSRVEAPYDVGVAEFEEGICVIGLLDGPAAAGDAVVPVVLSPYPDGRTFGFRRVD